MLSALWRSLSLLLVALPLIYAQAFENTAIVRTVDLGGASVHVTTTYAVKALEPSSKYVLALPGDVADKTSFLEVKVKGTREPLFYEFKGVDPSSQAHLYTVHLSEKSKTGQTLNLVAETVETHATTAWPPIVSQNDKQSLKYNTSVYIVSPYDTAVQRTKIRSPSPTIHSYTQEEGLETTKSGSTITYGPYHDVKSSLDDKFEQKTAHVHYSYEFPVLEIPTMKRAAEISHWGANLNIQDEIFLHNAGPELKGHFSRLAYQIQTHYQNPAAHTLSSLALRLPPGIRNAYYYDLVGNVSTSRLRTAPSPLKRSSAAAANQYSVLDLRPRYPVLGGWNYSFTLGWDAPLRDSASWDKKNGRYIVGVPLMTQINDAVVNDMEFKIVLPEGATDVEYFLPFPALNETQSTEVTYLDTVGRPTLTFKYDDLTDKHVGTIYVAYKVPFSAHLRKPLVVAAAFISLFALTLVGKRINLQLHASKKQ